MSTRSVPPKEEQCAAPNTTTAHTSTQMEAQRAEAVSSDVTRRHLTNVPSLNASVPRCSLSNRVALPQTSSVVSEPKGAFPSSAVFFGAQTNSYGNRNVKRQRSETQESVSQVTSVTGDVSARGSAGSVRFDDSVTDLFSFFKRLPHQFHFDKLFLDSGVVLALFHGLSDSERLIVLRLMGLSEPVRWEPFIIWHRGDRRTTVAALNALRSLHIVVLKQQLPAFAGSKTSEVGKTALSTSTLSSPASSSAPTSLNPVRSVVQSTASKTDPASSVAGSVKSYTITRLSVADVRYQLHPIFKKTLKYSLHHGLAAIPITQNKPPKHFPTRRTLHTHAARQWRHVTEWLVRGQARRDVQQRSFYGSSRDQKNRVPNVITNPDLIAIFRRLHLTSSFSSSDLKKGDSPAAVYSSPARLSLNVALQLDTLTNETFQWLLKDRQEQVSSICVYYVQAVYYGLFMCPDAAVNGGSNGATLTDQRLGGLLEMNGSDQKQKEKKTTFTMSLPPHSDEVVARQTLEVLQLLFTISEVLIGQPCSMSVLTSAQRRFIQLAYTIGLVWLYKPIGSKHFFPTPLAKLLQPSNPSLAHILSTVSHLTASIGSSLDVMDDNDDDDDTACVLRKANGSLCLSSLSIPSKFYYSAYRDCLARDMLEQRRGSLLQEQRRIEQKPMVPCAPFSEFGVIVESNFKVYAYTTTSSSLLVTIVARLCELSVITPCMVVGVLSRSSVMEAYKAGVTADNIIRFFNTHAHPAIYLKSQREGKPILPENIIAQLRIWEGERRRIRMNVACLFEFSKETDLTLFPLAVSRAEAGWLLMSTEVPASSNPNVKAFQTWKNKILEKRKTQASRPGDSVDGWAPLLAIHAQYKDDLTHFIRAVMRNTTKRP